MSVIDLQAYDPHRKEIKALRAIPKPDGKGGVRHFGDEYYLAFQHVTEILTKKAMQAPPEEKVVFVFDLEKNKKSNALELFDSVKRDEKNSFGYRMQAASFGDSIEYPGLQAADLLAFEVLHHFGGVVYGRTGETQRWQWDMLSKGKTVSLDIEHFTGKNMHLLMDHIRAQWGANGLEIGRG